MPDVFDRKHEIVGTSSELRELLELIERVAATSSTVLIEGESGTGKELVARALHNNSPRSDRPLVAINCAALTESLLESELFGHEKGAFTGAVARKKGKIEMAEGGTLFSMRSANLPLACGPSSCALCKSANLIPWAEPGR